MLRATTLTTALALSVAATALGPARPITAQTAPATDWPAAAAVALGSPFSVPGSESPPQPPRQALTPESGSGIVGTTILAGALGLAGLYGGAVLTWNTGGGALVVPLLGAVVGGMTGGGIATGRWDKAFVGSLVGTGLGIAAVAATGPNAGSGQLIVSYALVHGLTTALFTAAR